MPVGESSKTNCACCAPPLGLWALCSVGLETFQKKKCIILTNTMRAETAAT